MPLASSVTTTAIPCTTSTGSASSTNTPDRSLIQSGPIIVSRMPFLDGLRALAIFWVLGFHSRGPIGQVFAGRSGWAGVDAFFVISGFLITIILLSERSKTGTVSLRDFYIRRALRLVPVYSCWIVLTCLVNPRHCLCLPAAAGIAAIYMVDLDIALLWNHIVGSGFEIAWSLSVEEKFYLIWPALLKTFRRQLPVIGVIAIVACFVWRWYLISQGAYWIRISAAFDTKLDAVTIGCLAAIAVSNSKVRERLQRLARDPLVCISLLTFICVYIRKVGYPADALTLSDKIIFWNIKLPIFYFSVASLIACLYVQPASVPARLLALAPMAWLGRISYSIYLWHVFAFRWTMFLPFPKQATAMEVELVKYALTVLLAALSYYGLEKPFLKLKERFARANTME